MDEVKHEKCNRCKCYSIPSEFLNEKGRKLKTCKRCRDRAKAGRERYKCSHERQKYTCKECKGSSICTHGRMKPDCKECKGSSICTHGRRERRCKDCKGSGICTHGRQKHRCKDCGGSHICSHGRQKSQCKVCDPDGHLKGVVSSRICQAIGECKGYENYLKCNIQAFREHITAQFSDGMSWENYGKWEIDHIIPINYNNPSPEEILERLHYSNTQPLWAKDNAAKGDRLVPAG